MPDVVTFDGPNKIITEISAAGDNELDVFEIYSEWKVWVTQSDNMKYLQAFTPVGGDPITLTESLDITYFLENGWRIRPAELSHKLLLNGNVFTREPGQSVFVDTIGSFTVNAETKTSTVVRLLTPENTVLSDAEKDDIINRLFLYILENGETYAETMRLIRADAAGSIVKTGDVHELRNAANTKTRITATADETGRDVTATDGT
jgi:hypothetical protein